MSVPNYFINYVAFLKESKHFISSAKGEKTDFGKNESWYFIDAPKSGKIYAGCKAKTAEELKGKTPTSAQKATIEKEIKRAVNLRSACQATNIGVSLVLLGLIVPIFTRHKTKKKHAEALKLAQENSSSESSNRDKETIVPTKVATAKA